MTDHTTELLTDGYEGSQGSCTSNNTWKKTVLTSYPFRPTNTWSMKTRPWPVTTGRRSASPTRRPWRSSSGLQAAAMSVSLWWSVKAVNALLARSLCKHEQLAAFVENCTHAFNDCVLAVSGQFCWAYNNSVLQLPSFLPALKRIHTLHGHLIDQI